MENAKTKKKDFVEITYTGYSNGKVFDSNIPEDLKTIDDKAKPQKTVAVIGEAMVVKGLDDYLGDKELNKEYEVEIKPADAFGSRDRKLIRTIPLSSFTNQKINPEVGMVLFLDGNLVKVIATSGARVTVDFNHPLAGKDLKYKFKIIRILKEEKDKVESLLEFYFKKLPDYELNEKVKIKGPKNFGVFVEIYKNKFKEIIGKELVFEEAKEKAESKKDKKSEAKKI